MANARHLLLHSNYSVTQIAEQVGYYDRRYFSRQFLRFHKMTPKQWRIFHDGNETYHENPLHPLPELSKSDNEMACTLAAELSTSLS